MAFVKTLQRRIMLNRLSLPSSCACACAPHRAPPFNTVGHRWISGNVEDENKCHENGDDESAREEDRNNEKEHEEKSVWPKGFTYTNSYCYPHARTLHAQIKETAQTFDALKSVEPRFLTDKEHPAYNNGNGVGLFATEDLPAGTLLGAYTGLISSPFLDEDLDGTFVYELSCDVWIDAKEYGNEFRI